MDSATASPASRRWGEATTPLRTEPPVLRISQLLSSWQEANGRLLIARQRGLRAKQDPAHLDHLVAAEREARQLYLVAEDRRRQARNGRG
jgi:hypothetical protein